VSRGAVRQLWGACALACFVLAGCGSRSSLAGFEPPLVGSGGTPGTGGLPTGGLPGSGGIPGTGGILATGGTPGTGGLGSGGIAPSGGGGGGEGGGGSESGGAPPTGGFGGMGGLPQIEGIDYLKSPFPRMDDALGHSVALSADGRTLAVGIHQDSSAAVGINDDPSVLGASRAGAVVVYWHDGSTWAQQAYIKASNPDEYDYFGIGLSLSADGNRLAVGASGEDGSGTGTTGDPLDNGAAGSGAVYVFDRVGSSWTEEVYLKAGDAWALDFFGTDVALSPDGTTLAVGAPGEDGADTGVNGDQTSGALPGSGAVYVFIDSGSGFSQQAYLKASNTGASDGFGSSVTLSGNGNTLAVTAVQEDSAAPGVDGDQNDDSVESAGAVYVFSRSGTDWAQTAYLKASNPGPSDYFGLDIGISSSGNSLAIAAPGEGSMSSGINGDQSSDAGLTVGAVYVFSYVSSAWQQEAYVKASNPQEAAFGSGLALSGDGQSLLVGAYLEASAAAGIDGNQDDESLFAAGAAYFFSRGPAGWAQTHYLKASNPIGLARLGRSVALDYFGDTAVVCADGENGSSPGINGDQSNQSTFRSGAAYVYYDLD